MRKEAANGRLSDSPIIRVTTYKGELYMKKRKLGLLTGTTLSAAAVLAACGGGSDESSGGGDGEETYEWTFVTEENEGQVQYEYAQEFASRMDEKTDGQVAIEPVEFGGLGSEVDQVEQLQQGAVEMAVVSPGFTGTMVEEGQVFSLQFLLPNAQEDVQQVLNESEALNDTLAARYEEEDIMPLSFWSEGAMQWTGNKAIESPDDFDGFQMRTQNSPLLQQTYREYGADPQVMSAGELYTALDNGTVDGQENPLFFIEASSYDEVQSHLMISNQNSYVAMTTVNPQFYNELPDDLKETFDETVTEMQDWVYDEQVEQNEQARETMTSESDIEQVELNEDQRAEFREVTMPMRDYYVEEVGGDAEEILTTLEDEIEEITGETVE